MTIPEAIQLIETTQLPTLNMLILPATVVKRENSAHMPATDSTLIRRNQQKVENNNSHNNLEINGTVKDNRINSYENQTSNERPKLRNQSPPPLPRPPEALYKQVVKEMQDFNKEPAIIKNTLIPGKSTTLSGTVYGQSVMVPNPEVFAQYKETDDASSEGSFYEKTSTTEDGDPLSFLVTIERRKNEPWGICFAYRRQKDLTDIQIPTLEAGGIAQR